MRVSKDDPTEKLHRAQDESLYKEYSELGQHLRGEKAMQDIAARGASGVPLDGTVLTRAVEPKQ